MATMGGGVGVRLSYEPTTDILTVTLQEEADIADMAEDTAGTVFAHDAEGRLVLIAIADASRNLDKIRDIERIVSRLAQRILGHPDATEAGR